ncbi:MAG: hypothetical protein LH467_03815, partial [Gemmatimonadaceae bacterium]|nr:hypothetical protein [Gemmatimonadaceae bacterium]
MSEGKMCHPRRLPTAFVIVMTTAMFATAGCRANDELRPEVAPLTVTGDSTLAVAGTTLLTATWDTLTVASGQPVSWTSSDSSVAFTYRASTWSSRVSLVGRRAGVVTITASNDAGVARHVVSVRDERPVIRVALGDSIAGQLVDGVAPQRIAIALPARDTIDIAVTTSGELPYDIRVERTGSGERLQRAFNGAGTLIYGMVPWSGQGTFDVEVSTALPCIFRGCGGNASYTLHVRKSAPIFHVVPWNFRAYALPQGDRLKDTVWVQNLGIGSTTAALSSAAPWLRPDVPDVTVAGPSEPPVRDGPVPTGAAPVVSTIDATTVTPGTYSSSVRMDVPAGVWTSDRLANRTHRFVNIRVYDSTTRVISRTGALSLLAASPDGRLYGARGDSVFTVDPSSGSTTPLVVVTRGGVKGRVYQLTVGADSALYVGVWLSASDSIYKVTNGSLSSVMGWPDLQTGPFAVTADGSVYAFHKGQLFRRGLDGSPELMATLSSSTPLSGM